MNMPGTRESGELILPSLDTHFLAADATASPLTESSVSSAAEPLEMPELPENAEEEPMDSLNTEEMSLPADDPLPLEFPALQTGVFPASTPEEATIVDEQSVQVPARPTTEDGSAGPPQPEYAKTELELGNPDFPKQTDAFLAATPEETTIADEQPPPLPIKPVAEPDTIAPPEAPVFPDLPEQTDAFLTPPPEEATIVDEQPPPLPSRHTPVDFTNAPPDTGFATVKLDIDHTEPPEEPMFLDLPEQTDTFLTPSPEEATIVDEQPPPLPSGHPPTDCTIAPPDTGETTLELEMGEFDEELDEETKDPETSAQKSKKPNRDTDHESSQ